MPSVYADPLIGLDGNPGTEGSPKQTFDALLATITRNADQNLYLRADRYHDVLPTLRSIQGAHIRIRRYGDGGNPCIDARNWIAPGSNRFTLEGAADKGGFVWSIQIGTAATAYRVWSKSTNTGVLLHQRTVGEALRHVPNESPYGMGDDLAKIKATLSDEDTWYGAGAGLQFKIYIWTKDQIDPADYWGGLAVSQSGAGTTGVDYAFNITRTQDLVVSGIDTFGTRSQPVLIASADTQATPTTNIILEDCHFRGASFGVTVRQTTTATGLANKLTVISDVLFRRCTVDVSTSEREQEPSHLKYGRLAGATDLWIFTGLIDNVRCEDCVSINGNHSGMTMGALDANSSLPKRTGFRRHLVKADKWNTYARGAGVFLCEPSCFIENCVFDGMNVRTQLSGSPLVTSLKVINSRASIRDPGTDGHIGIEGYLSDRGTANIGTEKYLYNQPVNVRLVNCSFDASPGTPIEINLYNATLGSGLPPATIPDGSITFENVLFMDTSQDGVFMKTYQQDPLVIGLQKFSSLSVYKGAGKSEASVNLNGTIQAITSAPGFVNILTSDPKVSSDLRPLAESPLIGAGNPVGVKKDAAGRQFRPKPTIGAYESMTPPTRKLRTY